MNLLPSTLFLGLRNLPFRLSNPPLQAVHPQPLRRQPPVYPNSSPDHRACNSLTPLPLSSRRPSVSIGGFGLEQAALAVDPLAGRLIPTNLLRL